MQIFSGLAHRLSEHDGEFFGVKMDQFSWFLLLITSQSPFPSFEFLCENTLCPRELPQSIVDRPIAVVHAGIVAKYPQLCLFDDRIDTGTGEGEAVGEFRHRLSHLPTAIQLLSLIREQFGMLVHRALG